MSRVNELLDELQSIDTRKSAIENELRRYQGLAYIRFDSLAAILADPDVAAAVEWMTITLHHATGNSSVDIGLRALGQHLQQYREPKGGR